VCVEIICSLDDRSGGVEKREEKWPRRGGGISGKCGVGRASGEEAAWGVPGKRREKSFGGYRKVQEGGNHMFGEEVLWEKSRESG